MMIIYHMAEYMIVWIMVVFLVDNTDLVYYKSFPHITILVYQTIIDTNRLIIQFFSYYF